MSFTAFPGLRAVTALSAAAALLVLSACSATPGPAGTQETEGAAGSLPSSHVHGLAVDPESGQVLLATHEGLFDVTDQPGTRIGDVNDLMGFSPTQDPGVFYASGHPGPGSKMPNPMGLIRSSDGGQTWEQLSRQGESDFHALTTTKTGILGYDGTLRATTDGKTWTPVDVDFAPAVLAGHPNSDTVLATTTGGLQRSTDAGKTWSLTTDTPLIQFAAFASPAEAFGVEPDGTVHLSLDGGATWAQAGKIDGTVQAIAAAKGPDGKPGIWAATTEEIVVSSDGGATFQVAGAS